MAPSSARHDRAQECVFISSAIVSLFMPGNHDNFIYWWEREKKNVSLPAALLRVFFTDVQRSRVFFSAGVDILLANITVCLLR